MHTCISSLIRITVGSMYFGIQARKTPNRIRRIVVSALSSGCTPGSTISSTSVRHLVPVSWPTSSQRSCQLVASCRYLLVPLAPSLFPGVVVPTWRPKIMTSGSLGLRNRTMRCAARTWFSHVNKWKKLVAWIMLILPSSAARLLSPSPSFSMSPAANVALNFSRSSNRS